MRTRNRKGFTLVEILIVVVILGILAAIVIPQFTNASEDAKDSAAKSQLQTIRNQIELYRVKHNGVTPPSLDSGDFTDLVGDDYLRAAPVNPWNGATNVADAAAPDVGWIWADTDPNHTGNELSIVWHNPSTGDWETMPE
jgi:type II secretion system protein G